MTMLSHDEYRATTLYRVTLPGEYRYPELPDTVSHDDYLVTGESGDGIDGFVAKIYRYDSFGNCRAMIERRRFPTFDAAKAWELSRGYTLPWRYLGTPQHPSTIRIDAAKRATA